MRSVKPRPTPNRYSEIFDLMGVYGGIKNPEDVTGRSFAFLEALTRNPIVEAIIRKRVFQATRYARVVNPLTGNGGFGGNQTGWRIGQREERAAATPAVRRKIGETQELLAHGGFNRDWRGQLTRNPVTGEPGVWDGLGQERAMSFAELVGVLVRQSLTQDFAPLRNEPGQDANVAPIAFFGPTDVQRMRLVIPGVYKPKIDLTLKSVNMIELSPSGNGQAVREFSWERAEAWVRHRRVDWFGRGYGCPEGEWLVDVVACLALGFNYQQTYFDSSPPDTIVSIVGQPAVMQQQTVELLQQQMQEKSGLDKWNRVLFLPFGPNTTGNPLSVTPLRAAGSGMQEMGALREWFVTLTAMAAAIYGIHPEEFGFSGVTTQQATLNGEDPASALEHSRESGFLPLMESLGAFINRALIDRIDPDLQFEWINLSPNEARDPARVSVLMQQGLSPNEVFDLQGVPRRLTPLDPQLHRDVERKTRERQSETDEEFRERVNLAYEAACKKSGIDQPWSNFSDLPVGCPGAMQIVMGELAAIQQAKMAEQQQQQGQQPGQPPAGGPGAEEQQQPGQPQEGDEEEEEQQQPQQQGGEDYEEPDEQGQPQGHPGGFFKKSLADAGPRRVVRVTLRGGGQ